MRLAKIAMFLAALAVAAPAAAQQPVTLKFAAGTPSSSDMWRLGLTPILNKIVAASEGTLKIDTFPDGTLSTDGVTYDRVLAGVADMGWDLPLVYGARFQSIGVIGLPFKYDDAAMAGAAMWRMYEKGVFGNEVSDMKLLVFFVNPNVNLFFKTPLRDLTALEGRKVTVGSKFRGDIVTKMGGVAVALRPPELFQALSRGVADGSMTNVAVIQAFKLNEELHYYLDAPMGGAASFMFMNKTVFDRLPAKAQKAIADNTGEAASRAASGISQIAEAEFMKELLKDQRNKLVPFDAAATAKWRTSVEPLITEWHQSFPRGKIVADAFDAELAKK